MRPTTTALALSLALGGVFGTAAPPASPIPMLIEAPPRPEVQTLTLNLDDGTVLTLTADQLGGSEGGFLVWNSFGVTQIAMAYLSRRGDNTLSPDDIWNLWSPAVEATAPVALLVTGGTVKAIGAAQLGPRAQRAKLVSMNVMLSNGKSRLMPFKVIDDAINGVLVWGEPSLRATLVPFYDARPGLRANSGTVLTRWNTVNADGVLPATMTKPQCFPDGWP